MSVGGVIAMCALAYFCGWMHGSIWYGVKGYSEGLEDGRNEKPWSDAT